MADFPPLRPPALAPLGLGGLRPVQDLALATLLASEAPDGLFLGAGVGHGKTLVGLLAGGLVEAKRPVYMTRPKLVPQVEASIEHWALFGSADVRALLLGSPPRVVGYGALSSITRGETLLETLSPDLLILDEAHELGSAQSARTRRVDQYLRDHQATRVVVMTGTVTRRSLLDMAHLLSWALPRSAAGRLSWPVVTAWDAVIAPGGEPDEVSWSAIKPLLRWAGEPSTVEGAREAFRCLLEATPGVLLTRSTPTSKALTVKRWLPPAPPVIAEALRDLEGWVLPDGTEIVEATDHARARSSLALGFYYQRPEPDPDVALARDAWGLVLKRHLRRPFNSVGLVAKAAASGSLGSSAKRAWSRWLAVRGRWPRGEAVWLSDEIIAAAIWRARTRAPCVIWTSSTPVLEALGALGVKTHGAGSSIPDPSIDPVVAASIRVHGTGSNLDGYPRGLVLEPPAGGAGWEQLLGRHHRPGREADGTQGVEVEVYTRPWNMLRSLDEAGYLAGVTGSEQKLLKGLGRKSQPAP